MDAMVRRPSLIAVLFNRMAYCILAGFLSRKRAIQTVRGSMIDLFGPFDGPDTNKNG